ncbi:MAG TPA: hypothetical protein VNO34_02295 [Actinomycetota bacterium]|nr:hypothetical protein [Actinomycetota bacterium]
MGMWEVHLEVREPGGEPRRELYGTFPLEELPAILPQALDRARSRGGGVQVRRLWVPPGLGPGRPQGTETDDGGTP